MLVLVPPSVCFIYTPLNVPAWSRDLQAYPFQDLAQFFMSGITEGFRIGSNESLVSCTSAQKNLHGANFHPDVVQDYCDTKVWSHRVAGLFENLSHSHFGVIVNRNQVNK